MAEQSDMVDASCYGGCLLCAPGRHYPIAMVGVGDDPEALDGSEVGRVSFFFIKLGRVVARIIPVLVVAWYGHQEFSDGVPGHQDEPAWVASGYYFELLRRGELSHPDWWLLPARESPPLGKYIFGAAFVLCGKPIRSIEPLAAWHEGWYLRFGLDPNAGESGELRGTLSRRLDKRRRALRIGRRYPPIPDRDYLVGRYTALGFGMIAAAAVASLGLLALAAGPCKWGGSEH